MGQPFFRETSRSYIRFSGRTTAQSAFPFYSFLFLCSLVRVFQYTHLHTKQALIYSFRLLSFFYIILQLWSSTLLYVLISRFYPCSLGFISTVFYYVMQMTVSANKFFALDYLDVEIREVLRG